MSVVECSIACRSTAPGSACRCGCAEPAASSAARGTVVCKQDDDASSFPLRMIDCSAPISNAIIALCLQTLTPRAERSSSR